MHRTYLMCGSLLGALSVMLGAFGAHGLKQLVPVETISTFQTGVQYQFYHSIALLLAGIVYEKFPGKLMKWAGVTFVVGIILFSGSLYALTALHATNKVGLESIGIITPFGGLFFILGWLLFFAALAKKKEV